MKKIISLFLIFMSGCATYFHYDYDELKNNVVSAKIVEVSFEKDEIKINLIVTKEIESNKYDELFDNLSKINIKNVTGSPKVPNGLCLQLIYSDYYEIVYNRAIVYYKNTGEYIKGKNIGISTIIYNDFINKYKE